MLIAHVTFRTLPNDRAEALSALLDQVAEVRAMPGCVKYIPAEDASDPCGLIVVQAWESADRFDAYLASPPFARLGQSLRPLMTAPPVSQRFDATPCPG